MHVVSLKCTKTAIPLRLTQCLEIDLISIHKCLEIKSISIHKCLEIDLISRHYMYSKMSSIARARDKYGIGNIGIIYVLHPQRSI
jgi:hypothetical protein